MHCQVVYSWWFDTNKILDPPPRAAIKHMALIQKVKRKCKASTIAEGTNERPIEL